MTKTLADMTAKERQACVGMWCDHLLADNTTVERVIFVGDSEDYWYDRTSTSRTLAEYVIPLGLVEDDYLSQFTPRFDLPRAWNPDGTPPKGEWEEGWCYTGGTPTGDYACLIETQDGTAYTSEETPTGDIRRFITEWENTND